MVNNQYDRYKKALLTQGPKNRFRAVYFLRLQARGSMAKAIIIYAAMPAP